MIPTAAFISDLNIERMLQFRNINQYSFPVIGLIHSLGIPNIFDKLTRIFSLMKSNDSYICPSYHTQKRLSNTVYLRYNQLFFILVIININFFLIKKIKMH